MIIGTGIDMIEINRIEYAVLNNKRFIERVLTSSEQEVYKQYPSSKRQVEFLAGRFAAKEACAKAFGTGIGKRMGFQDISVLADRNGKPQLTVSAHILRSLNVEDGDSVRCHVSISHSKELAIAQVIIEG
ncbi:holo-ACP synthase [Caldalkalibacillus salinus]|uniref:holo-ACP synthase n=1 Tax=Caldalkalibacillus salinus TaxID=2803787 RepID=UPI0019206ED4|nr:holo-ACP synthase [Caldalkalibacillus salinus]